MSASSDKGGLSKAASRAPGSNCRPGLLLLLLAAGCDSKELMTNQ